MSHFTVLTAITLPEGVEDLLSQSSIQMSVCELAQATHSADIANKLKTNTVKAEALRNQLQFENFIETLAGYRLEPYWENTEDPRYLVFSDCTEDCRTEYESDGETLVRLLDGRWVRPFSTAFESIYTLDEGKIYKRSFGPLHHHKRTKKAKRMKTKYIPFKKMYRSLSTFAEEYCGLVRGEEPDSYGFYRNPDTRWDWFQIGGRWPDRFLVKADCPMVHTGEVSLLMQDYQGREAPEGYCWVAGARKKDIAWDVMREQRARAETEYFHKLESWYQNGQIPDDRRWFLSITDEGIRSWNALAYAKGETLEEHLHREGLSQSYCYPISTFACLGDKAGWNLARWGGSVSVITTRMTCLGIRWSSSLLLLCRRTPCCYPWIAIFNMVSSKMGLGGQKCTPSHLHYLGGLNGEQQKICRSAEEGHQCYPWQD